MSQAGRRRSSTLGLNLSRIDFDTNSPSQGIDHGKYVNGDYDDPTPGSKGAVHSPRCVKGTYQEHCDAECNAAINCAGSTAPLVSPDQCRDGDAEDDQCRDSGCEEACF